MAKKLYIGGLVDDITSPELKEVFEEFGEIVDAKVIKDRYTGNCRGFGFITFKNGEDADKAIEEADGGELDGKKIRVCEAKDKKSDGKGRGGKGGKS